MTSIPNTTNKETAPGVVNFPTNDPAYENTGEGGMFVRLVAREQERSFILCSGGENIISYDEAFTGHDGPEYTCECEPCRGLRENGLPDDSIQHQHFPWLGDDADLSRYQSVPYLAVLTIGSTLWSGWNTEQEDYWKCTYEDLSPDGKDLYSILRRMYPEAQLILQTWLDT